MYEKNVNISEFHRRDELSKVDTLRVRAFFHKTVRVCHVYCNFKIGFTCRITVIFGRLKDGSLLINTLASNICFRVIAGWRLATDRVTWPGYIPWGRSQITWLDHFLEAWECFIIGVFPGFFHVEVVEFYNFNWFCFSYETFIVYETWKIKLKVSLFWLLILLT